MGILLGFASAQADTNSWVDATMLRLDAMDFDFSRSQSDIPFQPVMALSLRAYGKTEFQRVEGDVDVAGAFRTRSASAYAAVPLYIGEQGFALAVPYVGYTQFHFVEGGPSDEDVTSVYLPLATLWQTDRGNQWGVFVMPSTYSPLQGDGAWAWSGMGGMMGRHLSGERLVWYYGAVYDYSFSDGYTLPYVGFTYNVDPSLSVAMIAPWPSVNYAPNNRFFLRVGVAPSGASWAIEQEGNDKQAITSFGGWDLGVWANWRISKATWCSVGGGVSGLRSLEIDPDGDVLFEQDTSDEPWISVTWSVRPP